jgi:putative ABC transport system ATP-binding protein
MEPLIKTENLKVIYNLGKSNEVRALDGVDIEIYPQEYIIFFGPSGCGKSTLLYTILGLQRPTYGKIFIKGKDLTTFSEGELVRYRRSEVGIIFQAYYLIPTIDILDNVVLPKIFLNERPQKRNQRAIQLLQRFSVFDQAKKLPTALSGGQQQRVAISRALVNDPEIILADEPVGNLDSTSAEIVMETLREINEKDKKTIVLVTHDPRYIHYAHRVYHLKDGKVIRETINPEKRQIKVISGKERLFTELDKMARVYPYASEEDLKARVLANYLTQEITEQQIKRLEESIKKLFKKEINLKEFYLILDKPLEKGGVGLYKQTAKAFTERIGKIFEEVESLKLEMREGYIADQKKELAIRLRKYLLDNYKGQISYLQLERLDKTIEKRISGELNKKKFQNQLDKPIKFGGVGLNKATAKNFSRQLELLLAQAKNYEI